MLKYLDFWDYATFAALPIIYRVPLTFRETVSTGSAYASYARF